MRFVAIAPRIGAFLKAAAVAVALVAAAAPSAEARSKAEINAGVDTALQELFRLHPAAKDLYANAAATLVFPNIVKGGLILGASYGQGGLVINGVVENYWSFGSASIGFQAGGHRVRRVMFFMSEYALRRFLEQEGATLAADLELTVVDGGGEIGLDVANRELKVIVINFGQEGFLGGASLKGGKYTRIAAF